MRHFLKDPRHYQICALSALLIIQMSWSDFAPDMAVPFITVASCLIVQAVCFLVFVRPLVSFRRCILRRNTSKHEKPESGQCKQPDSGLRRSDTKMLDLRRSDAKMLDLRSAFITSLSLSILLKASAWYFYPLAALIGIGAKFTVRYDGKHIFNPANIAIVSLLLAFPNDIWISPGQWGTEVWIGFLLICLAFLVLYRLPRADMTLQFLGIWTCFVMARAFWLDDPIDLPMNQLQNGALLIFCFFMISDPKTIPDHIWGRTIFAFAVSVIAYILTYVLQVREGVFFALAAVCLIRPLIDTILKAPRYRWPSLKGET